MLVLVALFALQAAIASSASASTYLAIETPRAGSYTEDPRPLISGLSDEPGVPVQVTLASGGRPVGAPLAAVADETGHWEVAPGAPLAPGTYTAIASQRGFGLEEEEEQSAPVTFSVIAPPALSIAPISSPSSDLTPTFSGRAGAQSWDVPEVTVKIYSWRAATGKPIESASGATSGEAWVVGPVPALPEGTYTAIAEQDYHGEHPAVSDSITFTLVTPPPLTPPTASLTWVPATPVAGEPVALISTALGGSNPIVAYEWDPSGTGAFVAGGAVFTTTFANAGPHTVHLLVTDRRGMTASARATIIVAQARRHEIQPFPVVRIAGSITAGGVRVRLLSVQAPPGALVRVRCLGRHCGRKTLTRLVRASASSTRTGMSALTLAPFEHTLAAGTVLQVFVTRGSDIGKYTSFVIRRGRLPLRNDACLQPSSTHPIACPSS